eukprot:gene7298-5140_t
MSAVCPLVDCTAAVDNADNMNAQAPFKAVPWYHGCDSNSFLCAVPTATSYSYQRSAVYTGPAKVPAEETYTRHNPYSPCLEPSASTAAESFEECYSCPVTPERPAAATPQKQHKPAAVPTPSARPAAPQMNLNHVQQLRPNSQCTSAGSRVTRTIVVADVDRSSGRPIPRAISEVLRSPMKA